MRVKLIKKSLPNTDLKIWSLTLNEIYEVIGIEADDYRIVDDTGEPYLFPNEFFKIVDDKYPDFWDIFISKENEKYCYPPNWNKKGFFEDYFNNISLVREQFWNDYNIYFKKNK